MINVTSENRLAARKLLTFCGTDSRIVRTMTLVELGDALQRAVNSGLVTQQQIDRLLSKEKERYQSEKDTRGKEHGESEDWQDQDEDEYRQEQSQDNDGYEGNDTGDSDDGKQDSDGAKDSDAKSDSESESKSGADSDDDAEDSGDDGGESESENDKDSDDEKAGEENDGDENENADEDEAQDGDEDEAQNDEDSEQDEDDDTPLEHEAFPRVLKYIRAGLNVALVGPAGTGKSYIARQVASTLDLDFHVNGAMMSKYDLIGYNDAHGTYHATPAHDAFKHGGVHCFDELDASAPDAVVAFNGMTDDQPFYTFPCGQVEQHENYVAIACMNTWGNGASADYVGRYKQDAASMSRFVKVFVGYDRKIEKRIAGKHVDILHRVWALRDSCEQLGIRHIVSTRMIVQAIAARVKGKATRTELDADIFFAGLDDAAVKQLKTRVNAAQKEYDNAK